MSDHDDIIYGPIAGPAGPIDFKKHPTTVKEWILLLDAILLSGGDGPKVRDELKLITNVDDVMTPFGHFGGMWVRNITHLWQPDVTPTLVLDVRQLALTHRVEILANGTIVDADQPTSGNSDNTLKHPDNMSWVLVSLYADWLQGKLVL